MKIKFKCVNDPGRRDDIMAKFMYIITTSDTELFVWSET